jgi:hypothetical protein
MPEPPNEQSAVRYRADGSSRLALLSRRMNGKKKPTAKPFSNDVLDYPCTMSDFERESLAAEAKLKTDKTKPPKPRKA